MVHFREEIIKQLKKETGENEIEVEVPSNPEFGDYAFPCFTLAKKLKRNPNEIAQELCKKVQLSHIIKKIEIKGAYLNFFIDRKKLAEFTLKGISEQKGGYGKGTKKNERVMIEFSQPNTHKAFHIGHLRNVALGDSLVRIMRFNRYNVISANYINDSGAHVAKCIWYYLKKYNGKEPKQKKGEWLGKIYSEAAKEIEQNEDYKNEVSTIHKKLEEGDKELTALWKKTKQWSMDDFNAIYKQLNISFDKWFFDNELTKPGKAIVKELLKKKVAEESEGAIIINLEKYGFGIALILKSDGTALYLTKDLALAKEKFQKNKIDTSIYVVASEQNLHFKQLFRILELYGFKQAKKCHHLSYELVMLKEGKMSSREGNIVLYSELAENIVKEAENEVKKRHNDWSKKDIGKAAWQIALGALKFGMLTQDNSKVIIFDTAKAIDFEGETAAYIQYAHARICSILRKYGKKPNTNVDFSLLKEKEEENIIKLLSAFPDIIDKASQQYKPNMLARYLLDLSQSFNEFYHKCQILKEEEKLRDARLVLISCVKQVLSNGLNLLGIEAPERM